jgi:hypothetical protein
MARVPNFEYDLASRLDGPEHSREQSDVAV